MNVKKFFLAAFSAIIMFSACSKDDSGKSEVISVAEANLLAKYPNAQNITWATKGNYNIATFTTPVTKQGTVVNHSAWFNKSGDWNMTETDVEYTELPAPIKTAFEASVYASWKIDDIDYINRPGMGEVFIIEVEGMESGAEVEIDLYYSPDGVLIKALYDTDEDDDYENMIPADLSEKITNFLKEKYPNASIIEVDFEDNFFEVEIIENKIVRDIIFDKDSNWKATITEVEEEDLPQAVKDAIANSEYAEAEIDDIDFYETADKNYYVIEIEINDKEIEIKISEDGVIF